MVAAEVVSLGLLPLLLPYYGFIIVCTTLMVSMAKKANYKEDLKLRVVLAHTEDKKSHQENQQEGQEVREEV